jgi:hypothetical protein
MTIEIACEGDALGECAMSGGRPVIRHVNEILFLPYKWTFFVIAAHDQACYFRLPVRI